MCNHSMHILMTGVSWEGVSVGSFGLPGAREDPNGAPVVDERDDADGPSDAAGGCCGGGPEGRWTKSYCAVEAEECMLDEEPCGQVQDLRETDGEP